MADPFVCVNGLDLEAAWTVMRAAGCQPVEGLVPAVVAAAIGECIPATVETHNEHKNGPPRGCCQRFVSAWQPVKDDQ